MTQSWILVSDDGSTKCVLTTSPVRDFILEKGLRLSGLTIMPYTNQVSRVYAFNTALGIGRIDYNLNQERVYIIEVKGPVVADVLELHIRMLEFAGAVNETPGLFSKYTWKRFLSRLGISHRRQPPAMKTEVVNTLSIHCKLLHSVKLKEIPDCTFVWVRLGEIAACLRNDAKSIWEENFKNWNDAEFGIITVAFRREDGRIFVGGIRKDGNNSFGETPFGDSDKFLEMLPDVYILAENLKGFGSMQITK